jgi:hypothetical protein
MGSVLHPMGSEPSGVYWRRRAVVIAAAVVLVVLVAWIAWPKGSGSAAPAPQITASTTSPAGSPATASVTPSVSTSASPTGPVACDPASVAMNLAGYQKVKQGSKQVLRVTIKNTATPCVLQVNPTNFDLTVKSGTDRIWTTGDCAKWVPLAKDVQLKQGQTHQFDLTWGLVRSKPTCATTKDALKPGTYVATATFAKRVTALQIFVIAKAN